MSDFYAIVVLGGAVRDNDQPSPTLRGRLDTGADAYFAKRAPRLIVTGLGEAGPMQRYLVARGIPEEHIELERRALSTHDNAVLVAAMLPKGASVLVVTQSSHLRRALGLFRRCGVHADGLAARGPFGLRSRVRERIVYLHHRLMGWV